MTDLENSMHTADTPPDAEDVLICDWCGRGIYPGDKYYDIDPDIACEDCVKSTARTAE